MERVERYPFGLRKMDLVPLLWFPSEDPAEVWARARRHHFTMAQCQRCVWELTGVVARSPKWEKPRA